MQLTEMYSFDYALTPGPSESAQIPTPHQKLAPNHKLVLAFASLGEISHHSNNPPSAAAHAGFGDYVEGGQSKDAKGMPMVLGKNITDVKWNFKADRCWATASFVILCFD